MGGEYAVILYFGFCIVGAVIGIMVAASEGESIIGCAIIGWVLCCIAGMIIVWLIQIPSYVDVDDIVKKEKIEKEVTDLVSLERKDGEKRVFGGYVSLGFWGRGGVTEGKTPDKIIYNEIDSEGIIREKELIIVKKDGDGEKSIPYGFKALEENETPYLSHRWTEKVTTTPAFEGNKFQFAREKTVEREIIGEKEYIFHLPEESLPAKFLTN